MKKIKFRSIFIAVILCLSLLFTACSEAIEMAVDSESIEESIEESVQNAATGFFDSIINAIFPIDDEEGRNMFEVFGDASQDIFDLENTDEALNSEGDEASENSEDETEFKEDEIIQENPEDDAVEEEAKPEEIIINENFKNAILNDNGHIKQIHSGFSGEIMAELFMGGIPIIYYNQPSQSTLTYYQFVMDGTDLHSIWANASSLNDRGMPNYNLFPDTFVVEFMSHASPTMIKDVFPNAPQEIAGSRSIDDLNAYLGVENEGEFIPGESNAVMTVSDKYVYTYHYDGITIIASGSEENIINQFIMYEIGNEPDYLIY